MAKILRKYFHQPDPNNTWIRNPFSCDIEKIENLSEQEQDELIDWVTNGKMKNIFGDKKLIDFWLIVQNYQKQMAEKALRHLIPFCTTYRCEQAFSTYCYMKNKYRNRLNIDADLRVKISSMQPDLDEIMNKKERFHLSHKVLRVVQGVLLPNFVIFLPFSQQYAAVVALNQVIRPGRASVINWAPPVTTPPSQPDVLTPPPITVRRRVDTSTPPPQDSTSCTPVIVSPPPAQLSAQRSGETSPATTALARPDSPLPNEEGVPYTENIPKNIKRKKSRMLRVNRPGFIEIESSLGRTIVWYFRKNIDNIASYRAFLNSIEYELIAKLRERVRINPIKYNLKLEATYDIPNLHNSAQNRAFKTSARELYAHSNIEALIDRDFSALLAEEDCYAGKYSGFTLSHIDGLLLGVYEYSPMGGSSSVLGKDDQIIIWIR
ncbi:hypothetical protein QTP88_002268 [Uroleucon formosanum]